MRVVVALGGNALLRRGEPMTVENQRANVALACDAPRSARAASTSWSSRTATAPRSGCWRSRAPRTSEVPAYPLDVLGAETQGMIGYLVEQELGNRLPFETAAGHAAHDDRGRPGRSCLRRPDQADRADLRPSEAAERSSAERGWTFRPDGDALPPGRAVAGAEAHLRACARSRWLLEHGCVGDLRRRRRHPDRATSRTAGWSASRPSSTRTTPAACWPATLDADVFVMATDAAARLPRLRHAGRSGRSPRPTPTRSSPSTPTSSPPGRCCPRSTAACDFARATGKRRSSARSPTSRLLVGGRPAPGSPPTSTASIPRRSTATDEGELTWHSGVHSEVGKLRQGHGPPAGARAHPAHAVERRGAAVRRRALGRSRPSRSTTRSARSCATAASRCSRPRRSSPRRWRARGPRRGSSTTS